MVAHRRWGKDDVALHRTACAAHERIGTYWHLLPEASQARKAIWEAINPKTGKRRIDEAFPQALRAATRENEMFIKLKCGSTWQVVGSDNYDSLVGSPPIGIVFSEWALANPTAWAYLRPILAENAGWALFIYTPRGRNHGSDFYESAKTDPTWFCQKLNARETPVFTAEVLEKELAEYQREFGQEEGRQRFDQEYLCSFDAAVVGSYYGSLLTQAETEKRIGFFPYDPKALVTTAWDLGYGDDTAIWFAQLIGEECRLIDYYENRGVGLDHYAKILKEKPYAYHQHLLPHDGSKGELIAGTTIVANATALLGSNIEILPRVSIEDGINAVRVLLPKCRFDETRCAQGLKALRLYRRDYNEERKVFSGRPLHDWTSHCADAFRYLAMGLKEAPKPRTKDRLAQGANSWMG